MRGVRIYKDYTDFITDLKVSDIPFEYGGKAEPCWVPQKTKPTDKKPGCATFKRNPTGEQHGHRMLWKLHRPEPIKGWSLTKVCHTEGCVNPWHWFRGYYNGEKSARFQTPGSSAGTPS